MILKSKNLKVNEENYKKLKYDYNNMFSEGGGGKIPEYKIYANLNNKKDKSKYWKRTEFNGVIIVEDLKDYFPKDISKEEIDSKDKEGSFVKRFPAKETSLRAGGKTIDSGRDSMILSETSNT